MTLGFFDDIIIPPRFLQLPSRFEEAEQAWIWEYATEDGGKQDLYMDNGHKIRFRVTEELFEETSPVGPPNAESITGPDAIKTPYKIRVNILFDYDPI